MHLFLLHKKLPVCISILNIYGNLQLLQFESEGESLCDIKCDHWVKTLKSFN